MGEKKRFSFPIAKNPLPLYIETIGYNPYELDFDRPEFENKNGTAIENGKSRTFRQYRL